MLTAREKQMIDLAVLTAIDKVKKDKILLLEWLEALELKETKKNA